MKKTATDLLSALPSLLSLGLLFYLLPLRDACLSLFAVGVHEWGHVTCALLSGASLPHLSGQRGGFSLAASLPTERGYLLYAAGGCIANLLFFLLVLPLTAVPRLAESAYLFMAYSLLYCAFNLLPAPPLDGEKLLALLLPRVLGVARAAKAMTALRYTVIFLLLFSSLFLLLGNGSCFYGVFLSLTLLTASPTKIHVFEEKRRKSEKNEENERF
jgi:Zn-dependent protease